MRRHILRIGSAFLPCIQLEVLGDFPDGATPDQVKEHAVGRLMALFRAGTADNSAVWCALETKDEGETYAQSLAKPADRYSAKTHLADGTEWKPGLTGK